MINTSTVYIYITYIKTCWNLNILSDYGTHGIKWYGKYAENHI